MEFSDYQKKSRATAIYPNLGKNYVYPTLGLAGESGEVAEKIKKIIRDKGGIVAAEDREEIGKEIGDVLWYLAQICTELGIDLNEAAEDNLEKLKSRQVRRLINGSGDNR